jgi:hypothetical protein
MPENRGRVIKKMTYTEAQAWIRERGTDNVPVMVMLLLMAGAVVDIPKSLHAKRVEGEGIYDILELATKHQRSRAQTIGKKGALRVAMSTLLSARREDHNVRLVILSP